MFKNKLDLFVEYFLFLAVCTFCLQLSLNLNEKFNILKPEEEVKNLETRSANGGGVSNKAIGPGENVVMNAGNIVSYESEYYPSDEALLDYENKILGISFSYPESWGEARTKPASLTSIDLFFEEYRKGPSSNLNETKIEILFENSDVVLTFVNMESRDRDYFDIFIDNIDSLEGLESVCGLKTDGDIDLLYRKCEKEILHLFARKDSGNSNFDFIFIARNFAYKKIMTEHYNALLISKGVSDSSDIYGTSTKELSIDEYLYHLGVSKEEYDRERSRFMDLIGSIEVFEPREPEREFNIIADNDVMEVRLFKSYLNSLLVPDLEQAYVSLVNDDLSREGFFEDNSNVIVAKLLDVSNTEPDNFVANFAFQKYNEPEKKYRYFFQAQGDKLDIYKKEQIKEELEKDDLYAYVKRENEKNYVILVKEDNEIIVDEAYDNYDNRNLNEVYDYGVLEFSPRGSYLIYSQFGWEWYGKKIYNIDKQKLVSEVIFSYADILKVSDNEKYFFVCAESDFSGEYYAQVLSLPETELVFDAIGDTGLYYNDCVYDEAKGILNINLKTPFVMEDYEEENYKIDLANGTLLR